MSRYGAFAEYYDSLTSNVSYDETAKYVADILNENGIKKGILLDLACGTGTMSVQMAKRGYEVIGIDNSPEMLSEACEKAWKRTAPPNQDTVRGCRTARAKRMQTLLPNRPPRRQTPLPRLAVRK